MVMRRTIKSCHDDRAPDKTTGTDSNAVSVGSDALFWVFFGREKNMRISQNKC